MQNSSFLLAATAACALAAPASGQWIDLVEAPQRLVAPLDTCINDTEERDYASADLDHDGDADLVIVRKQPFTTTGRRTNLLLMNENGVLTDRTAQYATDTDVVTGDQGFLTPTNDREVVLVDVDGDTWVDIVTSVTLTDNELKHISHPRVYMNLGAPGGTWLGFRYEEARIPQMHPTAGPRFCGVSAGDVTGNGAPDLFFSNYESGGPLIFDYDDKLLINDGSGFFTDETTLRLAPEMYESFFGISNHIVDMNGDGFNDIVRLTANADPYHVGIAYNDPLNEGFFSTYEMVYNLSGYHSEVGDLNADGRMDIVVLDDGVDRYLLNQGNDGLGLATFNQLALSQDTGVINVGNVTIADLDNDGWLDLVNADMDVDIPGCNHSGFIFHNQGNPPNVTFVEDGEVIPEAMFSGVYDVEAMDIDGDGRLDLVVGRCTGTQVWMNIPPEGLAFAYPGGLPERVDPGQPTTIAVNVTSTGTSPALDGTGKLHVSINGGAFTEVAMTSTGVNQYEVDLPAADCTDAIDYYFSAAIHGGTTFTDPEEAPTTTHLAVSADDLVTTLDTLETVPAAGWVVQNILLENGFTGWEQGVPEGTLFGGNVANPETDATEDAGAVNAFVTGLAAGAVAASNDVDGESRLLSPVVDLTDADAIITYARWFFWSAGTPDVLTVEISNDGGAAWTPVPEHTTAGTGGAWERVSLRVGDYLTPTADVRLRFTAKDSPNDSLAEAGIDDLQVDRFVCDDAPLCDGDTDGSGAVDIDDVINVILDFGTDGAANNGDADGSGLVDIDDVVFTILQFGNTCP